MSSIHIRPRFKAKYKIKPEEVGKLVRKHLSDLDCGCAAEILPNFVVLNIRTQDQHFWSPQLSISFEADEEDDSFTLIHGLYGPNPTVWAFFFYGYVALGILAAFLGMYGFSLYSLGPRCQHSLGTSRAGRGRINTLLNCSIRTKDWCRANVHPTPFL